MAARGRSSASQCEFTIAYQPRRPDQKPSVLACGTPYQSLPDPVLAERIPLVFLVWSGAGLPIPTMPPFWVGPGRATPLPTFTTAAKGLGDTEHIVASIGHQGTGWPGWHRVIAVDNGAAQWRTLKESQNGGGRYRKEKKF